MPRQSIAIIGAGPSGCAVLNAFLQDKQLDNFNIVCFEKQKSVGGQWNLDWHVGHGEDGEVVHSGMYKHLWSNAPKECLEYPDKTMKDFYGQPLPSYPPRPVIEKYIKNRFEVPEILSRIRFQTLVKNVKFDENTEKFHLDSYNLQSKIETSETFDYLFVCTGHYHNPHMIYKPGFENFEGRVMHAHDFKDGRQFKGQTIVTIGSSFSAEDIASNCVKYGAKKAYLSAREKDAGQPWYAYKWPENIIRVPDIDRVEGNKIYFKEDGREQHEPVEADVIICCTGYRHYYPYLEKKLRLEVLDSMYPEGLYKGIFWSSNPKVMYIGAYKQFFTMPCFEVQSWYARDVILGRIELPASQKLREESNREWRDKLESLPSPLDAIGFQGDMILDLMKETNYFGNTFKVKVLVKNFEQFVLNKMNVSIMAFRDLAHIDPRTMEPSPKLNGTWMEIKDDSTESYLKLLEKK